LGGGAMNGHTAGQIKGDSILSVYDGNTLCICRSEGTRTIREIFALAGIERYSGKNKTNLCSPQRNVFLGRRHDRADGPCRAT